MCSVASPRWLCVATGTLSRIRSICSPETAGRPGAREHGPRRAPARRDMPSCPSRTRRPYRAFRARMPPRGRAACRSPASGYPTPAPACAPDSVPRSSPRRARRPGAHARALRCGAPASRRERRLAEDDLADRVVDDLLEARHVRALLVATQINEAIQSRKEELSRMRTTFSTPLTPTRESPTCTPGRRACTSSTGLPVRDSVEIARVARTAAKRSVPHPPPRTRARGPLEPPAADSGINRHANSSEQRNATGGLASGWGGRSGSAAPRGDG